MAMLEDAREKISEVVKSATIGQLVWLLVSAGGVSLIYITGLLSYVGLEFSHLFPASSLIDGISYFALYGLFAALIVGVIGTLLNIPVFAFEKCAMGLLKFLPMTNGSIEYAEAFFLTFRRILFSIVATYALALILAVHIGHDVAFLLSLPIFIMIVLFAFWGVRAIRNSAYSALVLLLVFQIGLARAWLVSQEPFRFVLHDTSGGEQYVNILLSTSAGTIYAANGSSFSALRNIPPTNQTDNIGSLNDYVLSLARAEVVFVYVPSSRISAIRPSGSLQNDWYNVVFSTAELAKSARSSICYARGNCIDSSFAQLPGLLTGVAYMFGTILGVFGIINLKDHVENPSQHPL